MLEKIRKNSNEFEKIRKTSSLTIRNLIRRQNNSIRSIRKILNSIDSKVLFQFKKFEKNQFEIRSIRFDSTPKSNLEFV